MAFGLFTLTARFLDLGQTPATGTVRVDGVPEVIIDTTGSTGTPATTIPRTIPFTVSSGGGGGGHGFRVGPATEQLDSTGAVSFQLPTDASSGNSLTIRYRVTPKLHGVLDFPLVEFYAAAIGTTVDLSDLM